MGSEEAPRETRSKGLKVNLTPSMHERLTDLATRLGMSPAALCSIAIAEYVANKTAAFEAQREVMQRLVDSVSPQLLPLIEAMTEQIKKD